MTLCAIIVPDSPGYYGPFDSDWSAGVKEIELLSGGRYTPNHLAIVPAAWQEDGTLYIDRLIWNKFRNCWQRSYMTQPGDDFTEAEKAALDLGAAFAARHEWPYGWMVYCSEWSEPVRTFQTQEAASTHITKLFAAAESLLVKKETE